MAVNESSFQRLKAICVPLLGNSHLTPSLTPVVSSQLSQLDVCLNELRNSCALTGPLISYTFFPITTILRRNPSSAISDHLLEKLLGIMAILCDAWWWDCDSVVWEQKIMFCSAVLGDVLSKGKAKGRDDETKLAATRCARALLRRHTSTDLKTRSDLTNVQTEARLEQLQRHASSEKMIQVLGQLLSSLLDLVNSHHLPLQLLSLETIGLMVSTYIPTKALPAVLPGVVSGSAKAALGVSGGKGWANGEVVASALQVIKDVIVACMSDTICIREGAVSQINSLDDLGSVLELKSVGASDQSSSKGTLYTPSWLRATSSQLHIALNSLSPLVTHANPKALHALVDFSSTILSETQLTLPQSQTLLTSHLLSLSRSAFPKVASHAQQSLTQLLSSTSNIRTSLMRTTIDLTRDSISALPRLIHSHADAKVQHAAEIIEAICGLTILVGGAFVGVTPMASGLAHLLGPNGGIEKWGWTLIRALEMTENPVTIVQEDYTRLLQSETSSHLLFPALTMRHIESAETRETLSRMLRALGQAAGDSSLFSIEWLVSIGVSDRDKEAVTALWCAGRILEGAGQVTLSAPETGAIRMKRPRLEKTSRGLAMSIAETWDKNELATNDSRPEAAGPTQDVQIIKGTLNLPDHLKVVQSLGQSSNLPRNTLQQSLHRVTCLQLLAIVAGVLQARFTPLLLHVLYPVIHSLVVEDHLVSSTGWATLHFITVSTSYASPANLLLSNFDYVLDSISRRLTRRWLDPDAARVLSLLVRLVGSDIVDRAGDIVEECFDRLDDYHGYESIVEGLISVLSDVVTVVAETEPPLVREPIPEAPGTAEERNTMAAFEDWFIHRHDPPNDQDNSDLGPPGSLLGEKMDEDEAVDQNEDPLAPPPPTPVQALTKQIVSRSLYFLTHGSAVIRAKILNLLASSVQVLPESAILPSVHQAWPFVLNRLADPQPFVISAAASFIEALSTHVGSFMTRRVWDDVWPRFKKLLSGLETADSASALARRGATSVGTQSAYTHSHRLYRSILKTMISAVSGVRAQDSSSWEVIMAFRRFLQKEAHPELQTLAKDLYKALSKNNKDAIWLALLSTSGHLDAKVAGFMAQPKWDMSGNLQDLESSL